MTQPPPVRPAGLRLGLRANLAQFCLLVGVNALVGGMVGQERSLLSLLATQVFGLAAVMARSPWPHITVTGPSGSRAGCRPPARVPNSTATAPGRWPSATSLAWRTSTTTPG